MKNKKNETEERINKMLKKSEPILNAGKPKPQTNEEWFCQLSTEEKAKVLNDLYWGFGYKAKLYYNLEPTKESFEKWLKQPHKEN